MVAAKRILWVGGALAAGVVAVVVALLLGIRHEARKTAPPTEPVPIEVVEPPPVATEVPFSSPRLAGVTLAASDPLVRELVARLSSHPQLVSWLVTEELVRRFVVAVHSAARGLSPREQLDFALPEEPFRVHRRGGKLLVDPVCYHRYDLAAEVFTSLDTAGSVALYRELGPLIAEAHREIAGPGESFDVTLRAAISELLATPTLEGDVEVSQKVVTFSFVDEQLEQLSAAQRHFLRMGPVNVGRVQAKLEELDAALRR